MGIISRFMRGLGTLDRFERARRLMFFAASQRSPPNGKVHPSDSVFQSFSTETPLPLVRSLARSTR